MPEARRPTSTRAVAAARKAFDEGPWPRMTPAERAEALLRVARRGRGALREMALAFTAEIGAPSWSADLFHQNALEDVERRGHAAETFPSRRPAHARRRRSRVVREPVGVVATIIPWNGPVATASLKIGPALAAGCTVMLKPAPEGPVSIMMLAEALEAAGLPEGVISIVAGRPRGRRVPGAHPGVDKVAFTGSTAAGRRIMSLCGERIARVTLELGGKSAAIIADDIPLDEVLPTIVPAGIGHSGQVCAALTRMLVPRKRHDEVVDGGRRDACGGMKVGDPMERRHGARPAGRRAPARSRRGLHRDRQGRGRAARDRRRHAPEGLEHGWYVEPTLFANVDNDMRIAQEEIFGPVLVRDPVRRRRRRGRASPTTRSTACRAPCSPTTASSPSGSRVACGPARSASTPGRCASSQPFGGFKQSGLGREGGPEGLAPYLETKMIIGSRRGAGRAPAAP